MEKNKPVMALTLEQRLANSLRFLLAMTYLVDQQKGLHPNHLPRFLEAMDQAYMLLHEVNGTEPH